MRSSPLLPVLAALLFVPPVVAQDVEMLGRFYGTRPPDAYRETVARDPGAFRFERAWTARSGLRAMTLPRYPGGDAPGAGGGTVGRAPGATAVEGSGATPADALGSRGSAVEGTFVVPLLLGLFQDSGETPPFTREQVAAHFFDGPNATGTITDFYREVSGGRVELGGQAFPWGRSTLTGAQVAGGSSGLGGGSRVGEFIMDLLAPMAGSVDWGRFDNDGPDGVPNSGDDDGFVDVLAVMHPLEGAECTNPAQGRGNHVWSHRWTLAGATGQVFRTRTPAANGGVIRVNDYTIQPVRSCSPRESINAIGVFAHELGHGFGLPDLYATADEEHAGIGGWGLMGTGSWGCRGLNEPERPCHMSAWSKAALGWVEVQTLPAGADLGTLTLDPVETSGRVYRIDAGDGSGDYYLLENRQPLGFDVTVASPGLLVWQIDPEQVSRLWPVNAVNASAARRGVWLRQADGRDDLGRAADDQGNRGDGGDPFPGTTAAAAFHAGSVPGSFSHGGAATGVTLLDVAMVGPRVRFRALTRYQTLGLAGAGPASSWVVDGDTLPPGDRALTTAPFQTRSVLAPGGRSLGEGVRQAFSGWSDDPAAGTARSWTAGTEDAALTALYEGERQVRLRIEVEGDTAGVAPGALEATPASPDGWYAPGLEVTVLARPRTGFDFVGWDGALAGAPNPARVALDGPLDAVARFEQAFAVGDGAGAVVSLVAATDAEVVFQAFEGTAPYRWSLASGALPEGLVLGDDGVLAGAPLEAGTFPLVVQARDGLGLLARAGVTLEVAEPTLGVGALVAPFFPGAPGAAGGLTAAERLYLDRRGNRDGAYDLGDFRAWVLAEPDLPMTEAERARVRVLVPLVDFRRSGGR